MAKKILIIFFVLSDDYSIQDLISAAKCIHSFHTLVLHTYGVVTRHVLKRLFVVFCFGLV